MKIHLRRIPNEGLHLEGEEDCPIQDLESDDVQCHGPMRYSLDVGISEGALWANGTLTQEVELRCVSCLEPFTHTIEVPAFALHTDLAGPETIDITPMMREDLLLNLPPYPRCDRHGGRVCTAAKVLRDSDPQGEEPRKPDWSALDDLKL
jgi:uncharacterized protein